MKIPPGGVPGGVVVDMVAAWWSVCRGGGFLADGGAGGGFVDDGLAGGVGGEQRGDGEPVDGPGQAAGLAVDGADRVVGYLGFERMFDMFALVGTLAYASVTVVRGGRLGGCRGGQVPGGRVRLWQASAWSCGRCGVSVTPFRVARGRGLR